MDEAGGARGVAAELGDEDDEDHQHHGRHDEHDPDHDDAAPPPQPPGGPRGPLAAPAQLRHPPQPQQQPQQQEQRLERGEEEDDDAQDEGREPAGEPPCFSVRLKHRKSHAWQTVEFATSVPDLQGHRFESVEAYVQFTDLLMRSRHPDLLRMYHKEDKRAPAWDHILKLEVPQVNKSASLCTHVCALCVEAQRPWQDCLVAVYYSDGKAKSANANSHMLNNHRDEWAALRRKGKSEARQPQTREEPEPADAPNAPPASKRLKLTSDANDEAAGQRGPPAKQQQQTSLAPALWQSTAINLNASEDLLPNLGRPPSRALTTEIPVATRSGPDLDKLTQSPLGVALRASLHRFIAESGLDPNIVRSPGLQNLLGAAARLSIDFTPQILTTRGEDLTAEFARSLDVLRSSLLRGQQARRHPFAGNPVLQIEPTPDGAASGAFAAVLTWIDARCWRLFRAAISVGRPRAIALRRLSILGLKPADFREIRRGLPADGHRLEAFTRKILLEPMGQTLPQPSEDRASSSVSHHEETSDVANNGSIHQDVDVVDGVSVDANRGVDHQSQDHERRIAQETQETQDSALSDRDANSLEPPRALIAEAIMLVRFLTDDPAQWAALASRLAAPGASPLLAACNEVEPWHLLQAILSEKLPIQAVLSAQDLPAADHLAQWQDEEWWTQLAHLEGVLYAALSLQFNSSDAPTTAIAVLSLLRARFLLSQPRIAVIARADGRRLRTAQDPRSLPFQRHDVACEPIDGFIDYLLPLDDGLHAESGVGAIHLDYAAQAVRESLVRELDRLIDEDAAELDEDHLVAMLCDPVFVNLGPRLMEMHPTYKTLLFRALSLFERAFAQELDNMHALSMSAARSNESNGVGSNGVEERDLEEGDEAADIASRSALQVHQYALQYNSSSSQLGGSGGFAGGASGAHPRVFTMANWRPLTDNTAPDPFVSFVTNAGVHANDFAEVNSDHEEVRRWLRLSVNWGTMHPTGTSLRDPFLASTQGAALEFWRQHADAFPTVSYLARRFLAIPPPFDMSPPLSSAVCGVAQLSREHELQLLTKMNTFAVTALEAVPPSSPGAAATPHALDLARDFMGDTPEADASTSSAAVSPAMPVV